ncbi:restriction endonuclease subunit S [Vibrio owensii]|uniref:restriction endonuclease subunit S n=1 Tax=Vibrio harveyi group TaxID=717610 RepID=UPI0022DDB915|nr:restriction endonuclease subunit S [Vibrio owensii]MDA0382506.1 restriction endonuclease subunit S [Vibrio owensii]
MSWPLVKLGEVAPSKALKKPVVRDEDNVWQLNLDMVESGSGKVLNKIKAPLSEAGSSTHWFDSRHVLYSKLRPYLNKVVLPDEQGLATTELVPMLPDPEMLDRRYLVHYLRSKQFVSWISDQVAGAKMPRVSMKVFWDHEIPLPPLDEQKRIAAILDKADAIRQKRKQAIDLADEFLRSVFLDMFGDPVTNPKGWEVRTLGDLAANKGDMVDGPFGSSVNTKVDYVENGEIPVIRTKNVSDKGTFKSDDLKFMTREKYETVIRSQVLPGDIVLTKVGTIGNVCIFPSDYPEAVLSTTGSCRIRLSSDMVTKTYIFFFLQLYKKKMLEIASAGVQPFLNMKHIKGFEVPIPTIESMERFESIVSKAKELTYNQNLSKPDTLFEGLSQKAFSGQL